MIRAALLAMALAAPARAAQVFGPASTLPNSVASMTFTSSGTTVYSVTSASSIHILSGGITWPDGTRSTGAFGGTDLSVKASSGINADITNLRALSAISSKAVSIDGTGAGLNVSGPSTATFFYGDGSALTNLPASGETNTFGTGGSSKTFLGPVEIRVGTGTSLYIGPGVSSPTFEIGSVVFSSRAHVALGPVDRVLAFNPSFVTGGNARRQLTLATFAPSNTAPGFFFVTASGTLVSPSPTAVSAILGAIGGMGIDSNGNLAAVAEIRYTVSSSSGYVAGNIPATIQFLTTNRTGTSASQRAVITGSGTLNIGLSDGAEIATRLELTDTSGSSPVFKVNGANSSVFQMDQAGNLRLDAGSWANKVAFSSAATFGVVQSTEAAGAAGAAVTVTCPAGTYAISGGCDCTGGTALASFVNRPAGTWTAGAGIQSGWTCEADGTVGAACAAMAYCSRIQ